MLNKVHIKDIYFYFLLVILISCNNISDKEKLSNTYNNQSLDTTTVLLKYNNTLFTLPSPYQATYTVKDNNIDFNKKLLNPANNVSNYVTNFQQALNIGVYGTDLGYLNIYDQIPDVISYFTVIKKLSRELGLDNALQVEIIDRIENNINDKDSLLELITGTYRQFDYYLKVNNRKESGVLILTGGWIESIYILSQNALESKNRQIIDRLGEQKHPLDNLIEILSPFYYNSKEYTDLIDSLVDLAYEFDGIIYNYNYLDTKVDVKNKITTINSKSIIMISEYHLKTITNKISSIRNKITY
ncbi:MAG: hypothetical protein JEY96_06615 [Bacteroidales bacterium]|nr:hypothetical protein [Bacteroidales bacterium]